VTETFKLGTPSDDPEKSGAANLSDPKSSRDLAKQREGVRSGVAWALVAILGFVILQLMVGVTWGTIPIDKIEKVSAVVLTPVVGLVGTVLGFYFGKESVG
jgi:hypothetical protein